MKSSCLQPTNNSNVDIVGRVDILAATRTIATFKVILATEPELAVVRAIRQATIDWPLAPIPTKLLP